MVQKAIDKGRLKFEEKTMKVDTNLFHIQANYVEPMQIMMSGASIGTSKVSTSLSKEEVNQALEEFKKEEELVFRLARDSLVDFLLKKQKDENEVMSCPRCSVMFDRSVSKAFESLEIRKSLKKLQETKVKEKEKQSASMTVSQVQKSYQCISEEVLRSSSKCSNKQVVSTREQKI